MPRRKHKTPTRLAIGALIARQAFVLRRRPKGAPKRILVSLYFEGLGDIILLTPLIATLHGLYPTAAITLTMPEAYLPLYAGRPYNVTAVAYDRHNVKTVWDLKRNGPYDLAIVPLANRQAWLARAVGARWIRGFVGDRWYYRLPIDELIPYPGSIAPFSDMWTHLAKEAVGAIYDKSDWPAPPLDQDLAIRGPYAVLHLAASSAVRNWEPHLWRRLAVALAERGLTIALTTGTNQSKLIHEVDPGGCYRHYPGNLSLAGLWHLLSDARLLVVPDTGVAHLAKLTQTPTVVLFGQCAPALYDPGRFWAGMPYRAITVADVPCRDQTWFADRPGVLGNLKRCMRSLEDCHHNRICMRDLRVDDVISAARELLQAE